MNAHAEKINIIQWIAGLDDNTILQQLINLKEQSKAKQADCFDQISEKEIQSIERALEDVKNGKITPHTEVRKKYEKWL